MLMEIGTIWYFGILKILIMILNSTDKYTLKFNKVIVLFVSNL